MRTSDSSSSPSSGTVTGSRPTRLRNQPEAQQVVRLDFGERVLGEGGELQRVRLDLGEADLPPARPGFDNLLQPRQCPAADEQDVLRVDLDVLLLRVLAATLRWHARDRSLEILRAACCTPSPLTSRVMLGFSDFRAILSISSM